MVWLKVMLGLAAVSNAQAETVLSRQMVIDKILSDSRESRRLDLNQQSAYTAYYRTFGAYDFTLGGRVGYLESKIRYLSGGGNLEDDTATYGLTLSKRLPTGTLLGIDYTRQRQNSSLRANQNFGGRNPLVVYDVGNFTLTQDLLGNFLGVAERELRTSAELSLQTAELAKVENKETLVLSTLTMFWNAYVAQQTLQEANFQKDKYEELVKEIQNKNRLAFVMPGDLPKAKAEYGARVRLVKNASYEYARTLELLLTALRMQDTSHTVRFDVQAEDIPPLPTLVMPIVDNLRAVQAAEKSFESANLTQKSLERTNTYPDVKFVAAVGLTGLGNNSRLALSDFGSTDYNQWSAGITVSYRFDSDLYRGNINEARVNSDLAFNSLGKQKEDSRQQIGVAMEQVRFTYAAAVSALDEFKNWSDALKAQEANFRQGRVDFSQLVIDYNSYYQSRITRLQAIGNYHIALDTYSSAVDDLLKN